MVSKPDRLLDFLVGQEKKQMPNANPVNVKKILLELTLKSASKHP